MTVQFEFAKTETGEIVHVSEAKKGVHYYCANSICNGEMISKKGEIREYHFAHKHKDYDHEGESPLHYNLKILLFEYIRSFVTDSKSLYIIQRCFPAESQKISIINDIDSVFIEKKASSKYRPDISLCSRDKLIIAVEIVVTHNLEHEAELYLKDHFIPCIKVVATDELYSLLLERYLKQEPDFLLAPDEAEFMKFDSKTEEQSSTESDIPPIVFYNPQVHEFEVNMPKDLDNTDPYLLDEYDNITVTYFAELGNIFPCYGFSPRDTDKEYGGIYISDVGGPFTGFRERIINGKIPCEDCLFYHSRPEQNKIVCTNPLAKLDKFKEHDNYITPIIFIFDKYYKSGKKHRDELVKNDVFKEIYRLQNSMDFFEYDAKTYEFASSGRQYMKVYDKKTGNWRAPNEVEINLKSEYFYCGKYAGRTVEDVLKIDKSYILWILKKQPSGDIFKNVLNVVNEMKRNNMI